MQSKQEKEEETTKEWSKSDEFFKRRTWQQPWPEEVPGLTQTIDFGFSCKDCQKIQQDNPAHVCKCYLRRSHETQICTREEANLKSIFKESTILYTFENNLGHGPLTTPDNPFIWMASTPIDVRNSGIKAILDERRDTKPERQSNNSIATVVCGICRKSGHESDDCTDDHE